jgi:hypothetical protein
MIRQAFRLEYITLAWMTIEAAVAIGSGVAADSLTLTAFGIDSLIELASATVLVWRLTVELRHGQGFENAERTAGLCCSRSLPMWSQAPAGNYGCGKARISRYRVLSSAFSLFQLCTCGHGKSCDSPTR